MVGETEILGQIKKAYDEAVERKSTGKVLNRLFQKSFQAAKWARTNTGISRGQVNLGNVLCELARRIFGGLISAGFSWWVQERSRRVHWKPLNPADPKLSL